MEQETFDTHHKALSLNLDLTIFGSFAEIGAGQEVARWFLLVGGASGTVAKSISAYDKEVSDQLYGTGSRYVSKQRLQAMLETEWQQLLGQLEDTRGGNTTFFTFVDTISARNYAGTNDCHGWMGLRFQLQPGALPNDIILHVNLRDPSNLQQQEAAGVLGVNLIYAVYHALTSPKTFLASVFENLGLERLEIDCLEWTGEAFTGWHRDEVHASLVAGDYAEAVVFPADNQLVPSNELLYKKALVLEPGRFENVDRLHLDLIENTLAHMAKEELEESKGGLGLFCLSFADKTPDKEISSILEQVVNLRQLGHGVMLFRSRELYTMSAFVNRYTKSRIYFAMGLTVLVRVLEDSYNELAGTLLEGIARLFTQNVRLCVYPMLAEELQRRADEAGLTGWVWNETDGVVSADQLHPSGPVDHLYRYLIGSGFVIVGKPGLRQ